MRRRRFFWRGLAASTLFAAQLAADGPGDNVPTAVRPVPPPGIKLSEADRQGLEEGAAQLGLAIGALRGELESRPALLARLPDIQIFHNAIRYAIGYNELFGTNEIAAARALIEQGLGRAQQLRAGQAPWTSATGLVVRGYHSRIDGSVQPYGLVVPSSYRPDTPHRFRLDLWFHGRDEKLSEINFLTQRQKSAGEFVPAHGFVLHTYGRYCNGQKFAGETDLFEALEAVRAQYPIDDNRVVVRGFSLGGAACWHAAVHHADRWAAAAPGAGFAETPDFLKIFQNERLQPAWFEKKLWHLYDCTDYAVNLFNCPVVAYSGEIDKQKQAADIMARALEAEGLRLVHVIGPQTAHKYHPQAKEEINRRLDGIVAQGRNPVPRQVRFTTWTLRYHRMFWLSVEGLEQHWERARVEAEYDLAGNIIRAVTKNVSSLTFSFPSGLYPLDLARPPKVVLDGESFGGPPALSDRSWTASFARHGLSGWQVAPPSREQGLRKRPGLQGPIDDAFLDSFLMVRPTGSGLNDNVSKWVAAEMVHATNEWRRHFRGEARVKDDADVTEEDVASHHLVLWGDPSSNKLLAKVGESLPVQWSAQGVQLGRQRFEASHHVPILIYPNPLNPERYLVLNSGFTFREYDYLNNARQVPKLPDYAVIDIAVPSSSRAPGGVVEAGFFGERWQLRDDRP